MEQFKSSIRRRIMKILQRFQTKLISAMNIFEYIVLTKFYSGKLPTILLQILVASLLCENVHWQRDMTGHTKLDFLLLISWFGLAGWPELWGEILRDRTVISPPSTTILRPLSANTVRLAKDQTEQHRLQSSLRQTQFSCYAPTQYFPL